ncbi:MAG: hypothetical protein ACXACI_15610 [Candidatus Hodarchaeales archaeon]
MEISKDETEALAIFYSDKPEQLRWWREKSDDIIVDCSGRTSARWNATIDFEISPVKAFNWMTPYKGIRVACSDSRVEQGILRTNRVAEHLRAQPLLLKANVEVLDRRIGIKFRYRDMPDARASVDLARDLVMALESAYLR